MLFWIFLVRCSSRSIVIFLIVSKEIQKSDQRKFYFFSEKKIFKFCIHDHRWKKKSQKKFTIVFFVHQNYKTKKFAISKISNTKFRKHQIQRNSRKYCEKNLRRNIFVKKKIFANKNSIIKIFTKKKFVEKMFRKKKSEKNFKNNFGNFLYLKKKFGWNSVNFRKKMKNNFCNFFIFEKKIGQFTNQRIENCRLKCRLISVNW